MMWCLIKHGDNITFTIWVLLMWHPLKCPDILFSTSFRIINFPCFLLYSFTVLHVIERYVEAEHLILSPMNNAHKRSTINRAYYTNPHRIGTTQTNDWTLVRDLLQNVCSFTRVNATQFVAMVTRNCVNFRTFISPLCYFIAYILVRRHLISPSVGNTLP
jgi:hypothetical protein